MKNRYDQIHQPFSKAEDKVDEVTEPTNSTEVCLNTKESLKFEELSKNDYNEELDYLQDKLELLKSRVSLLESKKENYIQSERALKQALYKSDLDIKHLLSIDSFSSILEKIHSSKKVLFDLIHSTRKQKLYLEQIKRKVSDKSQELEKKEVHLNQLTDSIKSLNSGFSRIKTYKSLDISTLQINLDVIQYQMEERLTRLSSPTSFNPENLKKFIQKTSQGFSFWSKREYEKKIENLSEKILEWEQKIAEITIKYEQEKGILLQSSARSRDKLSLIARVLKEDENKKRRSMNSSFKKEIELKIEDIEKETKKNKFLPGACVLENLRKRKNVRRI